MTLGDRFASLNRAQHSRPFKLIASVIVALLVVGLIVAYTVRVNAPVTDLASEAESAQVEGDTPGTPAAVRESATRATSRALEDVLAARTDPTGFAVIALAAGGVAIGAIWLGVGLTYLGILLVCGAVFYPLVLVDQTRTLGLSGLGLAGLVMSFTVLLQGLRVLYSGPGPVLAIARNVLAEAVRMKISLVFIVMVMLLLAALPGVLNDDQPLRYRVQAFMSFGTGLSFWVIAILTILFSAATLTIEQRDKIIWQTMTKPVSPWAYVLGKWLGVVGLNAVLLAVCAVGIFGFVEYLRGQPAIGETTAYVSADPQLGAVAPDRLALEQRVLCARVAVLLEPPLQKNSAEFQADVEEYIQAERLATPEFATDPIQRNEAEESLYKSYIDQYRAIAPGRNRRYEFKGLDRARDENLPLIFRHRVNVGSNAPDIRVNVSFAYGPMIPIPEILGAGVYQTVQITPCVILGDGAVFRVSDQGFDRAREAVEEGLIPGDIYETRDIIEQDGTLYLEVINGRLGLDRNTNQLMVVGNNATITFPPDGMEISFEAGGFRQNFMRGMALLWVKLAFLSMLTVTAATFLSFPVACMVSFGSFLAAEGSSYLLKSVQSFGWTSDEGTFQVFRFVAGMITIGVGELFSVYDRLDPIDSIIGGKLISWSDSLISLVSLAFVTALLFVIATTIFRRRELAIYSGK